MKFRKIVQLSLVAFMFGCSTDESMQLTENQKAKISDEIKALWQKSVEGIEQLDANSAFDIFSEDPDSKYVRNGHLYLSIEQARQQYAQWFSKPQPKKKLDYETFELDILDRNTVIITAVAKLYKVGDSTETAEPLTIGYTVVWRKEPVGWKVINMHTSWP